MSSTGFLVPAGEVDNGVPLKQLVQRAENIVQLGKQQDTLSSQVEARCLPSQFHDCREELTMAGDDLKLAVAANSRWVHPAPCVTIRIARVYCLLTSVAS